MQRIYEWRNGFTIAALQAVNSFWNGDPAYRNLDDKSGDGAFWSGDQVFKDRGERVEYARWAVAHDRKIPFLWNFVDDTDPINVVCSCMLSSFAINTCS